MKMDLKLNVNDELKSVKMKSPSLRPLPLWLFNNLLKYISKIIIRKNREMLTEVKLAVNGGKIQTLIIKPKNLAAHAPCLIYYPGGAFALRYGPQHIENAKTYAQQAQICVIFSTYRLAPKHPFPTGLEDAICAYDWVVNNASELGIDKTRIAIGGDSAGAALATIVAQKITTETDVRLCGQLLIYPVTDANCTTESINKYFDVPVWNGASTHKMWDLYLKNVDRQNPPPYATAIDGELNGLPPTYIETAELDPLRDEGQNYAQKLRNAEVMVEEIETKGTYHGFDMIAPNTNVAQAAIKKRVEFLERIFTPNG